MASTAQSIQFLLSQVSHGGGTTLSGGQVSFYESGTSTPKTVWIDRDKATPAANPYTLDSNGTAQLYGDGIYRIVIKDAAGVIRYDRDGLAFADYASDLSVIESKQLKHVSDYASLAAAVAAIGSTPATLAYNTDQTLSADFASPSTLELLPINGAVINHGGYSFNYAGSTSRWPMAQVLNGTGTVTLSGEVYPCWFAGTDAQKVQKALDTAMSQPRINYNPAQPEHNQVAFERLYNITGSTLKLNKASAVSESADRRVLRLVGKGGGLTKTDAGYWFTKGDAVDTVTGDVMAEKMNFVSLQGSGSVVWDAGTIIRFSSSYNTYKDVDTISATHTTAGPGGYPSFAQSLRFDHDHVTGGVGKLHLWKSSGDCKITNCLIENRNADATGGFLFNTPAEADTVNKVRNTSLVIRDNVIENFNGDCIKLGATNSTIISGNYFEYITGLIMDFATLQELNHYGITVQSNLLQATAAQVTASDPAIKWSKIAGGVVSIGNFRPNLAPVHRIVPPPDGGYGILTSINDYSTVATTDTNLAYVSILSGVVESTNAKSFGRLKQKTATLTETYGGTLAAGSTTAFVFTFPSVVRAYDTVSVTSNLPDSLSIHVRTPTGTTGLTAYVQNRSAAPVAAYTLTATAIGLAALGDN